MVATAHHEGHQQWHNSSSGQMDENKNTVNGEGGTQQKLTGKSYDVLPLKSGLQLMLLEKSLKVFFVISLEPLAYPEKPQTPLQWL